MMKTYTSRYLPFVAVILLAISSCGGSSRTWNADSGILNDSFEGYEMHFPAWGQWALADSTGNDEVLFCGVNKDIGVAVLLCKYAVDVEPKYLTDDIVKSYVEKIVAENQDSSVSYALPIISEDHYVGDKSYKFRQDVLIPIPGSSDTVAIAYVGYVFNHNYKDYSVVMTLPSKIADEHGDLIFPDIFGGLVMK